MLLQAIRLKRIFGEKIKHLIFSASAPTPEYVRAAQWLTERLQQSVLSVKTAGDSLPAAEEYKEEIWEPLVAPDSSTEEAGDEPADTPIGKIRKEAKELGVWTILRDGCLPEKEPWADWLHHPADLNKLLPDNGALTLPLNDMRVWPWISSPWPEE
ncbi:MAG: hypothetical protein ACYC35_12590 [Pirellulales bacterium]